MSVKHAGTALIEVTLSDTSGTYADQTVYVTVTVGKASLTVEPYAYGEGPDVPLTSATYGGLDGLTTALRYSYDGGANWTTTAPVWESGFVGSLAAGSINTTAGVGTLLVPVEQSEGAFSIGNEKHTGFFSRDYDVSYSTSSAIAVGKRALNVTLGNIKGTYGAVAPAFTWVYDAGAQPVGGGLASFDTEATVFQEDPTLEIDASVTGSSDFRSLSVKRDADGSVAAYEGAVFATGGSAANYEVTFTKGDLTVEPESLADAARIIAGADTTAFTYNGSTQAPAALSVTDAGSELTENTDYSVSLPDGSIDAGDYAVTLTGMGNYTGTATVAYTIAPAPLSVITEGASKVYDGTALTKADTATHVSDGEAKATADKLKIVNELGEDVTDKLSITYVDGTISIVPRRLFVSTKGGTKLYDGTPLAAIKGAKLEGLVAGDTATLVATGSQTDAGSSPNTYQIQWGTAQADDYQVSESLGTLTVTDSGSSDPAVKDSESANASSSSSSSVARSAAQVGGTPNTGDNTAPIAVAGVAGAGAALIALALWLRRKKNKR